MTLFEIKEDFLLDKQPFKILSGAVHYFRVHPDDWYQSLYNLKALGFNTVETYVPWNMHEPSQGQFDFSGILDIEKFLKLAQSLGLYAIVRPSPYICSEWEFGGFPAWLLNEEMRLRSSDSRYLDKVAAYYDVLLPKLTPCLLENGGNILMMQVENEYGSYGVDKTYLRALAQLMRERGVACPLFTSDGAWQATLKAGSLIDDDILVTGNFGSKAKHNFANMTAFFKQHGKNWPLMCMEFWDGWFNRWKEPIVTREVDELVDAIREAIRLGSINLYMFHGGTNFAFMNGCSARGEIDLPQITSYDYGALLDESGNPTARYFAVQEMLAEELPDIVQTAPLTKSFLASKEVALTEKVSLSATLSNLVEPVTSFYPQSMEKLGQSYGYLLYETFEQWDADEERLRVIDARDRVQVFIDNEKVATQYQTDIGTPITLTTKKDETSKISILVENMGRVNYGSKLLAVTQKKGIRQGVMRDIHFMGEWQHYPLPMTSAQKVDFSKEWIQGVPAFYAYDVEIESPEATYLDMTGFGKGIVFVNNHNIGRFWQVGPTLSLYVPKGFLRKGGNRIVVFETEGVYRESLRFVEAPVLMDIKKEENS